MYKIMYSIVQLQGAWFIWAAVLGNVLLCGFMAYFHHKAFHNGVYYQSERKGGLPKGRYVIGASALGYTGYTLAAAFIGNAGGTAAGIFAFTVLAIAGSFMGIIFLHKYWFIRQRMDHMLKIHPMLNKPKKERIR